MKKKIVAFAGGFQAYNMPAQQQPKAAVSNDKRYSMGAMQTMKQVYLEGGASTLLNGNSVLPAANFLESLNEEERVELTKKLIQPPPQSKLKHMIDDLY